MPRITNPGDITTAGGLANAGSVDPASLVPPPPTLDTVTVHIEDPSAAHMAATIRTVDAGAYYASDEVEGELQEVGATLLSGTQNGLISGGTFVAVGLNATMDATVVRIGVHVTLTGEVLALADNATNWMYVTPAGVLTSVVSVSPPSAFTPENVLLWRVVTAAGAVTARTDARFFVPNVDRKIPYTIRSVGAAGDVASEACFASIDAAMLWLEFFSNAGAPRPSMKTVVLVRGEQVLSDTVVVPMDGITFVGEAGGGFTTGAAVAPMFNLNGMDDIAFRDLIFTADHANVVCISDLGALHSNRLLLERCRFIDGASAWASVLELTEVTIPNRGHVVRDCAASVTDNGIIISRPNRCTISGCTITSNAAGTYGIDLSGNILGEGQSLVTSTTVTGFGTSIRVQGDDHVLQGCVFEDSTVGVHFGSGSRNTLTNSTINLSNADIAGRMIGVDVEASGSNILGCRILNPRVAWGATATTPAGVLVRAGFVGTRVTDTTIDGFYNSGSNVGDGVAALATAEDVWVEGCTISLTETAVNFLGSNLVVTGCRIETCHVGVLGFGPQVKVTDTVILLDSVRGETGIDLDDLEATVTGCDVAYTTGLINAVGIYARLGANACVVNGCRLTGFYEAVTPSGTGIRVANVGANITNCAMIGCYTGVRVSAGSTDTNIVGNNISCANSISATCVTVRGTDGGGTRTARLNIAGNSLTQGQVAGLSVTGHIRDMTVSGNIIDCGLPADFYAPVGPGILFTASGGSSHAEGVEITGNVVLRGTAGIVIQGTQPNPHANISVVGNTVHHCGYTQDLVAAAPDTFAGRGPAGVGMEFVERAVIQDNTIYKMGMLIDNAGVEDYPTTGAQAYVQSKGVYLRNCRSPVVQGNIITDMVAGGTVGGAFAPGCGVYVEYRSVGVVYPVLFADISGNNVSWTPGLVGGAFHDFGVYVEAAQGTDVTYKTLNNLRVTNNTVVSPNRCGVMVNVPEGGMLYNYTVSNNTVQNVNPTNLLTGVRAGVAVDIPVAGAGVLVPEVIAGTILGNRVQTCGTATHGVSVQSSRNAILMEVKIADNGVYSVGGSGVYFAGNAAADGLIKNVDIQHNTVLSAGASGILVSNGGIGTAVNLHDVGIVGNSVEVSANDGIALLNTVGASSNLRIEHNSVDDSGANGIEVYVNGASQMWHVCGNTVEDSVSKGIVVSQVDNSATRLVHVEGNTVYDFGTRGVDLQFADDLNGLTVANNSVALGAANCWGMYLYVVGAFNASSWASNTVKLESADFGMRFNLGGALDCVSWTGNSVYMTVSVAGDPAFTVEAGGGTQIRLVFTGNSIFGDPTALSPVVLETGAFAPDRSVCTNNTSNAFSAVEGWGDTGTAGSFCDNFTAASTTTGNWY